jgi:type VI secretion system (T6SS) phospholipase Tle1-like effector
MLKNIVIFSDGTGQAGGITFDEVRTNVYKMYRACRVGPDTTIDPIEQVAFYDPGLGSPADGSKIKIHWARAIYNLASKATGLGITANIIDCYAALIRLYRDGDRVFLIGFSRGAYTVRSLAGVMAYCGIPRKLPGSDPLPMDVKGSRALAERAVKDVYQFCSSYDKAKVGKYKLFMMETREAIAKKFRNEHGSSVGAGDEEKANIFPHFIGVFDTVAALGHRGLALLVIAVVLASPFIASFIVSLLSYAPDIPYLGRYLRELTYWRVFYVLAPLFILAAALTFLKNYLKWAPRLTGYGFWKRLATIHFAQPKHKFEDLTLNVNVGYAKHAISIDENRKDFKRVGWAPTAEKLDKRDAAGNLYFEQVWFSGVHADVGGGYEENESRLSDISLRWMLAAASIIPDGVKHDDTVLRLHPDASGPQHNEQKGSWLAVGQRALPGSRAIMHKTVYGRFSNASVVLFDIRGPYRPGNLAQHVDFAQYYDPSNRNPKPANPAQAVADDIEAKWQQAKNQSIAGTTTKAGS